jgi:hypothetical protein
MLSGLDRACSSKLDMSRRSVRYPVKSMGGERLEGAQLAA